MRTSALVNFLKRERIDVVFAEYGMVGALVTEACELANVPLIIHFHGADAHHRKTVSEYQDLYRKAFRYASSIIAVSGDMVEALVKLGAPRDKIIKSSCGVDTDKFPKIDISHSNRNFLSIGRFVEKKSPGSVVKAFKLVVQKFPDAKLWMVGQGPLFNETKKLINELALDNSIILTGVLNTEDIKKHIQRSRCFVQHSVTTEDGDMEGTPVTVLEAGSSGLAIVSTLHAGIKDAVINGETGYLVPEHDIEGMGAYMNKMASDVELASSLGLKEAAYIRQNFNIKDRIETLTTALFQALKNNHGKKADKYDNQ
ncbi:MAG: glycosyltransferase [Sphingobacteriales bacterium]